MIKIATVIFTFLLMNCAFTGSVNKRPVMVLNNHGGFSHGGLLIELMEDGRALVSTYSCVAEDKKPKRATYELGENRLVLRYPGGGVMELHKVTYNGEVYWADQREVPRLREDSERGEWARRVALRATGVASSTRTGGL